MKNTQVLNSAIEQAIVALDSSILKIVGDMQPSEVIEFIRALQELREEEAHYHGTIEKGNA